MPRTRSQSFGNKALTPYSQSKIVYRDSRPEVIYPPSYSTTVIDSLGSETMTDDVTHYGDVVNYCLHQKTHNDYTGYLTPWTWISYNSSGNYDEYRRYLWSWRASTGELKDTVSGTSAPGVDAMSVWREILNQADAAKCQISTLVTMAEIGQTVALFTKPWRAFRKLESLAGKEMWHTLRGMRTRDALLFASNSWLSWRYGYRPFLRDVRAIVQCKKRIKSAIAAEDRYNASVNRFTVNIPGSPVIARCPRTALTTLEITSVDVRSLVTVQAVVRPPEGYPQTYRHILGYFGIDQLTSAAWDVIPFSFVVDWFLPVGNLLNNMRRDKLGLTDQKRVTIRKCWKTSVSKVESERVRRQKVGNTSFEVQLAKFEVSTYSRQNYLLPLFQPSLLGSMSPWSVTRTADGAGLALQRLSKRR